MSKMVSRQDQFRLGLLFAVGSAAAFGVSGPFAKALLSAGWSPTAAVSARMAVGAMVMAIFATFVKPGWFSEARRHARTVVVFGLIPIAGAQLCYYNAVAHLSVGVALLLEYTAPLLVVGWLWATSRQRPSTLTLAGVAVAITGTMFVLEIFAGAIGDRFSMIGIAWAFGAALCAAFYFLMSDQVSSDGEGLDSITLTAGGLIVGAAAVILVGLSGIMPMTFTTQDTVLAGATVPWVVPVVLVGVIPTALAYTLGISGVARLRPSFASLVGLAEVLFAVLFAWVLVGEALTISQAMGAALVLTGLTLARRGQRETATNEVYDGRIDVPVAATPHG
jgi:drug/metabolite transporter (DMT)-like permease